MEKTRKSVKFVSKKSAEFLFLVQIVSVLRHKSICRVVAYLTIGHWEMYIYISGLLHYLLSLEINISVSSCSAIFEELMIVKYSLHSKNMDLAYECFITSQLYLNTCVYNAHVWLNFYAIGKTGSPCSIKYITTGWQ